MKSITASFAVAAGLTLAGSSIAVDMPTVAKKNGCANCHTIDKKLVGPAWQAVAEKYKGDAGAADALGAKIVKGGVGVWGSIPMPPAAKITDVEVKELVTFILGLAK